MAGDEPGGNEALLKQLLLLELRDRRRGRRWRLLRNLLLVVLLIALAWLVFGSRIPAAGGLGPHTAVINIRGEIAEDTDASAEALLPALRDALEDEGTRALVLLINSPGGSPVQAGIINDEIRRLRKKHDKPIYAVVEEVCASGAYYIAAAADRIYVDKASIVGSIGVLMDGFGFVDVMQKVGVERRLLTAGKNKGFLDPFSPLSDDQKRYAEQMLAQIHEQFIAVVKEGRGDRLGDAPDLFSGLFWTGQQAIELGLADELGSMDSVARDVVGAEEIIDYTQKPNLAERVARRFGAAIGRGMVNTLLGVAPVLR